MADSKEERRLEALTIWAQRVSASGSPAPGATDLASIATNPNGWAQRLDSPLLTSWSEAIEHLLHQVKFGVNPAVAVDQMPTELLHPAANLDVEFLVPPAAGASEPERTDPATEPETATPTDAPGSPIGDGRRAAIVAALIQWRARRVADGADGADLIKVLTLENFVKNAISGSDQISRKLPGSAAYLAPEIASVMAEFDNDDAEASSPLSPSAPSHSDITTAQSFSVPAPTPLPQATVPKHRSPDPGTMKDFAHTDFCEYEYPDSDIVPGPITIKTTTEGLRLAFEPYAPDAEKMVVYRVVSGDDFEPFKPEAGDLVAATTALQVHDNRHLSCAVRSYQVWCHVGTDHDDARRNQPFLHAQGEEVCPVNDFTVSEDQGRVIGRWTTFPGTRAVRVLRIPLEGSTPPRDDPRNQICIDQPNLTGFVDTEATRGMRYLYRVQAEVNVGVSVRLSRPKQQDIQVSVVLAAVDDLDVALSEDGSRFDLVWTTPQAGVVQVYRLSTPPPPGMAGDTMHTTALAAQGFTDESLIPDPVIAADAARSRVVGVPWPPSWERAYLTPITVLGDTARIGMTQVHTRPLPPVTDAEIIERFDTEIVSFGWPTGAAAVLAYVGSNTLPPQEICDRDQPYAEVSSARYRRDGGLILPKALEAKGCTVCLVPVSYSRGEQVRGQISAVRYPGLHRLRYAFSIVESPSRHIRELWLENYLEIESPIMLVMVSRPDRFPLEPHDGHPIYFTDPDSGEQAPRCLISALPTGQHPTGWKADWTQHRGFFRLFIAEQADQTKRYALADPPLNQLWLDPSIGAPQ